MTTLTDFLDLAIKAGVSAEALERAGFGKNGDGERTWMGDHHYVHLAMGTDRIALLAAEWIAIEWMVSYAAEYPIKIENVEYRHASSIRISLGDEACGEGPTLSAALAEALKAIGGE